MVGAGKSSAQGRILRLLDEANVPAEAWRFRTLPCFSFPFGSTPSLHAGATPGSSVRGRRYRRKRLTLAVTAGYIGRMIAFRAYCRWRQATGWTICNRYFYDNLAHYELNAPQARKYLTILRRFMPRPELAIVFVASPAVIAKRRPVYSTEYLEQVGRSYQSLIAEFSELVVLNSDPGGNAHEVVARLIAERLGRP
jgi:hypothetical protein